MSTKELTRVWRLDKHIRDKVDKLDHLRALVGNSGVRYDTDPVQSSSGLDRLERTIAEIVDLEKEIDEMIDRYTKYKEYVIEQIDRLPNERSRDVIYDRYILFMSFSEISAQLGGIDIRWIKRIHKRALQEYGEIDAKSSLDTRCSGLY